MKAQNHNSKGKIELRRLFNSESTIPVPTCREYPEYLAVVFRLDFLDSVFQRSGILYFVHTDESVSRTVIRERYPEYLRSSNEAGCSGFRVKRVIKDCLETV